MPAFRVPRDPPHQISCPNMILDDPAYAIGSFEGFLTVATDYATWFLESSIEFIIDDCLVSGGRLLRGIAYAQWALEARLRLHVETLKAQARDLESVAAIKDRYT